MCRCFRGHNIDIFYLPLMNMDHPYLQHKIISYLDNYNGECMKLLIYTFILKKLTLHSLNLKT